MRRPAVQIAGTRRLPLPRAQAGTSHLLCCSPVIHHGAMMSRSPDTPRGWPCGQKSTSGTHLHDCSKRTIQQHACAGSPDTPGAGPSSSIAAARAAAGGLGPPGAFTGSTTRAAPSEVCEGATPSEGGPFWQQPCDEDMGAQFSDGNDSDFEAPELADGPQPSAAGDAVPPEDDDFLEEGAPPPEPEDEGGEDDFWDE